jgi:hypothetical protein
MARRAISVAAQVADEALPGRVTRWRQNEATASPRIGPARRQKQGTGPDGIHRNRRGDGVALLALASVQMRAPEGRPAARLVRTTSRSSRDSAAYRRMRERRASRSRARGRLPLVLSERRRRPVHPPPFMGKRLSYARSRRESQPPQRTEHQPNLGAMGTSVIEPMTMPSAGPVTAPTAIAGPMRMRASLLSGSDC